MAERGPGGPAGGARGGLEDGSDGAGVDDPWGVPSVVHLRAAGTSLLLLADGPGAPRVLHWGGELGDLSVDETEALALAALSSSTEGAAPGSPLLPAGALSTRRPGDVGPARDAAPDRDPAPDRDQGSAPDAGPGPGTGAPPEAGPTPDLGPGLHLVAEPGAPQPQLARGHASLGVTGDGAQRLVVRSGDAALDLVVDVEVEMGPGGVLRLRASAAARRGGAVRLRGVHLALPVPAVGRQVLVDVGGRLRPARSLRPSAGEPASTGRSGDAVVVQTAGRGREELWAMASSAGRGSRLGGPPGTPVVRAARQPDGALALVGGTDASAADGALRWATPVLVAVHGDAWPRVRRRLDAALGPG